MILDGNRGRLEPIIDEDGRPILRLIDYDNGGVIEHQAKSPTTKTTRLKWTEDIPTNSLSGILTVDSLGVVTYSIPLDFYSPLSTVSLDASYNQTQLEEKFNDLVNRINDLQTTLANANIIQPQSIVVEVADAATAIARTRGPKTLNLGSSPATAIASASLPRSIKIAKTVARAEDPTVTIS